LTTDTSPHTDTTARLPAQPTPADHNTLVGGNSATTDNTPGSTDAGKGTAADASGDQAPDTDDTKKPGRLGTWFSAQTTRTTTGARSLGAALAHWGATGDQGNEEIRRRLVLAQLEAHTERRTEAEAALRAAAKKVVRLEEDAADGGLTQAQRQQLVLGRETVRRLEKTLKDLHKAPFRPVQPGERQIDRARGFARLRRGALLTAGATATVLLAVQQPQVGLLGLLAATCLAWWTGAHPPRLAQRPIPEELLLPELDLPKGTPAADAPSAEQAAASVPLFPGDMGEPFPIRTADNAAVAGECLRRALADEGLAIGAVTDVTREKWGWKATAHLTKGKPSGLVLRLPELDVALGVRTGGVMAQPQAAAASSVVLRVLLADPFDPMPPHPVYPPRSNSILKPVTLGPSLDGTPTQVTLAGQNVMVIAVPGGGKSAIVRNLADYITSCTDAIVVDIDPTGRGLGPLRRLAALRAYDEKRIDDTLDWAIREAELRTEQMGDDVDNWQVGDDSPAVFVLVDEHPQLSPKQKQKVIKLGRIGRKARVTVILLSQDATSDVVGDAIADVFGIRIMLPSRKADVPLVVGSDTAISEGWMPHRLVPSPGDWDLADVGCFYIIAPGLRDPILRKATFLDAPTATRRTQERLAAGTVTVTVGPAKGAGDENLPQILMLLREAFERLGDPDFLPTDQVLEHLATAGPEWRRWDGQEPADRRREGVKAIGRELKKAGIESLKTVRRPDLDKINPPSGYLLAHIEAAFDTLPLTRSVTASRPG
jgi:hypothetical protein